MKNKILVSFSTLTLTFDLNSRLWGIFISKYLYSYIFLYLLHLDNFHALKLLYKLLFFNFEKSIEKLTLQSDITQSEINRVK